MDVTTALTSKGAFPLRDLLDVVDDSELLASLQSRTHKDGRIERPQFSARVLLRAYIVKRVFNIRHNGLLVTWLRTSQGLQISCGFFERIPSARTFNRFIARLEEHRSLLAQCMNRVTALLAERLGGSGKTFAGGNGWPYPSYPEDHKAAPPTGQSKREPERRYVMNPPSLIYPTTAPWPGQDDGDAGRQQRGLAIAAQVPIKKNKVGYLVPSQSGKGSYVVSTDCDYCTCPDFELTRRPCKHIYGVAFNIQREEGHSPALEILVLDTSAPEPARLTLPAAVPEPASEPERPTRDWRAYHRSQIHEGDLFPVLLKELCDTVDQPPYNGGRRALDISDVLLAAGLHAYGTMSVRRSMSSVRRAHADGLLEKPLSSSTVFRCLENPEITPILEQLIGKAAWPLKDVETHFSPDSSGFSLKAYNRWFDHKHGKKGKKRKEQEGKTEQKWVKAHIMTGSRTGIVTAAVVSNKIDNDSPHLIPFLEATAERFNVLEVSADKAYLSKRNLRAIEKVGANGYIPFKVNSKPFTPNHKEDKVWSKAYYYYHLHREEFLSFYHQRSNVESAFSSIKGKFGDWLRTRKPESHVNHVLLRILCHNVCCLIRSMYELGVPVSFDEAPVPVLDEQALVLAA